MKAIENKRLQAATDAVQRLLGSKDRRWVEHIAMSALKAADDCVRDRQKDKAKRIGRFVMTGQPSSNGSEG